MYKYLTHFPFFLSAPLPLFSIALSPPPSPLYPSTTFQFNSHSEYLLLPLGLCFNGSLNVCFCFFLHIYIYFSTQTWTQRYTICRKLTFIIMCNWTTKWCRRKVIHIRLNMNMKSLNIIVWCVTKMRTEFLLAFTLTHTIKASRQ